MVGHMMSYKVSWEDTHKLVFQVNLRNASKEVNVWIKNNVNYQDISQTVKSKQDFIKNRVIPIIEIFDFVKRTYISDCIKKETQIRLP